MRTGALLLIGAALIFGAVNWQIVAKEHLRSTGQPVFLSLAPRDPRSILQGDYMALNFAVARSITNAIDIGTVPGTAQVAILKLDPKRVADFVRLDNGEPLGLDEVRFRFRIRKGAVWLGTNAFFFHEGQETRYAPARFGEFRVNEAGDAMLVDMRDQNLGKM
ncbi:MAG TPA: GDYXXLXY domain-containing protein [Bryobacteraceae bacterium]|jgi:uncharacterized membrane-anchored protein